MMYTFKKIIGVFLIAVGILMLAFFCLQLILGFPFSIPKDNFLWGILFIALGTIIFPEDELYAISDNLDELNKKISKKNE